MRLCVIGTGRSGTTMMEKMLNMHPDLFVYNETHWVPKLYEQYGTMRVETSKLFDTVLRTNHVNGKPTTKLDTIDQLTFVKKFPKMGVKEFCDRLGLLFAQSFGKEFWGDKTPDYGYYMYQLYTLWPDCLFIHIIRDGLPVANSMSKHIGFQELARKKQLCWCPLSFDFNQNNEKNETSALREYVNLWYMRFLRIRNEAELLPPKNYMEIRYEELISNPTIWLQKIAKRSGLKTSKEWIEKASSMINQNKVKSPRPIDILEHFNNSEKQLLENLGYLLNDQNEKLQLSTLESIKGLKLLTSKPNFSTKEVIVVSMIRNEILRLPWFLKHHRKIGIKHFIIIDNDSNDGSTEYLNRQSDVTLLWTNASYSKSSCGIQWQNDVLDYFAKNQWVLVLDADELFIYPDYETLKITELTNYLESVNADAFTAPMLDMYSKRAIRNTQYVSGEPFIKSCPFFDSDGYQFESNKQKTIIRGGPRERLFWSETGLDYPSPFLKKIPLMLWSDNRKLEASTHKLKEAKFSSASGLILHFKFMQDFAERSIEEAQRKEHFADARQYSAYAKGFLANPKLNAYHEKSIRFKNSQQLIDLGFIYKPNNYPNLSGRKKI